MATRKVVLRTFGVVIVFPVLIKSVLLLTQGGNITVQEAAPASTISVPTTMREPVFIAIIPLVFSLVVVVGFVKGRFSFLWAGCVGLIITGVLFMFSLGIHISIVGLISLILTFILARVSTFDTRQKHSC